MLTLINAPSITMLATFTVPSCSASSLVGIATTSMSPLADEVSTIEELTQMRPPAGMML